MRLALADLWRGDVDPVCVCELCLAPRKYAEAEILRRVKRGDLPDRLPDDVAMWLLEQTANKKQLLLARIRNWWRGVKNIR